MVDKSCLSDSYISHKTKSSDYEKKTIFEKFIHSLLLLEELSLVLEPGSFVFKGGTALLLLFSKEATRYSIDVDISMDYKFYKGNELINNLKKIKGKVFYKVEEDKRKNIKPIKHFKFYYESLYKKFNNEAYVILDIVFQDIKFNSNQIDIAHPKIKQNGLPAKVNTIDIDGLLGDKLTAFAPTTIGINYNSKNQYGKNKSTEIVKQICDINLLINKHNDFNSVSNIYKKVANWQLKYVNDNSSLKLKDCLVDTIKACELILRAKESEKNYKIYLNGIIGFNNYIIDKEITAVDLYKYAVRIDIFATKILRTLDNNVKKYNLLDDFFKNKQINKNELKIDLNDDCLYEEFVKICTNYL